MNELTFVMLKERAKYVIEELGECISVSEYDDKYTKLTIRDLDGYKLLLLFHAGVKKGHDILKKQENGNTNN